jgi:hypothetical protein
MTEIMGITLLHELSVLRILIPKPKYRHLLVEQKLGKM